MHDPQVPDDLSNMPSVVMNPESIGNPDESPRLYAGPDLRRLLAPCPGGSEGWCGGVNGHHQVTCSVRPTPTRDELIDLCERGLVPQAKWHNRDSAKAQLQLGEALVLLRAGCDFTLAGSPLSTEDTWWIEVVYKGFGWFEEHEMYDETFYIPTAQRLEKRAGDDWY